MAASEVPPTAVVCVKLCDVAVGHEEMTRNPCDSGSIVVVEEGQSDVSVVADTAAVNVSATSATAVPLTTDTVMSKDALSVGSVSPQPHPDESAATPSSHVRKNGPSQNIDVTVPNLAPVMLVFCTMTRSSTGILVAT